MEAKSYNPLQFPSLLLSRGKNCSELQALSWAVYLFPPVCSAQKTEKLSVLWFPENPSLKTSVVNLHHQINIKWTLITNEGLFYRLPLWATFLLQPWVSLNTFSCRDGAILNVFIPSYKGSNPVILFMGKVSRRNTCWWTMTCGSSSIIAKHGWAIWLRES